MKLELTKEEIPSTLETIIDDKHQKELADWLLKLYEQKAIELKEEILAMLEEKVQKQQVLKKNMTDRQRGIDAILNRCNDYKAIQELKMRRERLQEEFMQAFIKLENDFVQIETRKMREIQARSMDRETKAIQDMNEAHFNEKKQIFEKYLPDSLIKDLFDEVRARDQEDLRLYQKELDHQKEQKLLEMEHEDQRM